MYLAARREATALHLALHGDWHAAALADIEAELQALDVGGVQRASIDANEARLDLAGAWLLRDFIARARAAGVQTQFQGPEPPTMALLERCAAGPIPRGRSRISAGAPGAGRATWARGSISSAGSASRCCGGWRSRGGCGRSRSPATSMTPASPPCRSYR